jgi:hypothetical protein
MTGAALRLAWIAILLATSCTPTQTGSIDGVWCWGTEYHSAKVPFVRLTRKDAGLAVETKHYMHDGFESVTRDVRVEGNHLEFTYWYAPLERWSRCSFERSGDRMSGVCDGETSVKHWGVVPSQLWRCGTGGADG